MSRIISAIEVVRLFGEAMADYVRYRATTG